MEVDMIEHVHRYSIEELKEPLSALTKPKKRYWLIYINAINNFFFNSRFTYFMRLWVNRTAISIHSI